MGNRDWSAAGYLEHGDRTEGEMKAEFEANLLATKTLVGGPMTDGVLGGTLTIATASITPTTWFHPVDTEGGASSDTLSYISGTNLESGAIVVLSAESPSRVIYVHDDGLANIQLVGGTLFTMDTAGKFIVLIYWGGTTWRELFRSYGGSDSDWYKTHCSHIQALSLRTTTEQLVRGHTTFGTTQDPTQIRIKNNADPTVSSTTHALQVGPDTNINLGIGSGGIQCRDQLVAAADLEINRYGGEVFLGGTGTGVAEDPSDDYTAWTPANSGNGQGSVGATGDADMVDGAHGEALIDPGELWIGHIETADSDGGAFTNGDWRDRAYKPTSPIRNNMGGDAASDASTITLPAGTFRTRIMCAAYAVGGHQIRLRQTSGTPKTIAVGMVATAPSGVQNYSYLTSTFTLTGTQTLKVQHRCETTNATDGMGRGYAFGENGMFVDAHFWKISL